MADLNNFLIRKRKDFSATNCTRLSPTNDSVDDRPSDHAIPSTMKPKGRVGVVQKPEMGVEDFDCQTKMDSEVQNMVPKFKIKIKNNDLEDERRMKSRVEKVSSCPTGKSAEKSKPETQVKAFNFQTKTDGELEEMITRIKKSILTLGHRLPDKGEKMKAIVRKCVAELERRNRSRVDKDERLEDVKRIKGKLITAETKIMELEAHVVDLQEKLHDSAVQLDVSEEEKKELANRLDVAEKKCASVADDSKWLLEEGLPLLVRKLVSELSKESSITVSQLRSWHQRSRSDSS